MLNKLSLETEEVFGRIESGANQLAEAESARDSLIEREEAEREKTEQETTLTRYTLSGQESSEHPTPKRILEREVWW